MGTNTAAASSSANLSVGITRSETALRALGLGTGVACGTPPREVNAGYTRMFVTTEKARNRVADDAVAARELLTAAEGCLESQRQIVAGLLASGQKTSQAQKVLQIMERYVQSLRDNLAHATDAARHHH